MVGGTSILTKESGSCLLFCLNVNLCYRFCSSTVAYLQAHHIEVEPIRIDPITGKKFTFFQDPDQLPIELYERG